MSGNSVFDVSRLNNQARNTSRQDGNTEQEYLYKAAKYHNKTHQLLVKMMTSGKSCPNGFQKYLQPFKQ
jgi:hypothetical protein